MIYIFLFIQRLYCVLWVFCIFKVYQHFCLPSPFSHLLSPGSYLLPLVSPLISSISDLLFAPPLVSPHSSSVGGRVDCIRGAEVDRQEEWRLFAWRRGSRLTASTGVWGGGGGSCVCNCISVLKKVVTPENLWHCEKLWHVKKGGKNPQWHVWVKPQDIRYRWTIQRKEMNGGYGSYSTLWGYIIPNLLSSVKN